MASHILASPNAASSRQASLTPRANTMFSRTMAMHLRPMRMALAIITGSSSISTTSAASMAASEPRAPMAIPTSARASTGASLMPSPTKASRSPLPFSAKSCSTQSTLSAGSSPARYSRMPTWSATFSATEALSPVSITRRLTPLRRSWDTAWGADSLTWSAMTICPP